MDRVSDTPKEVVVIVRVKPRDPTILEEMITLRLLRSYLRVMSGIDLTSGRLPGMPPDVNAYWLWMNLRDDVTG